MDIVLNNIEVLRVKRFKGQPLYDYQSFYSNTWHMLYVTSGRFGAYVNGNLQNLTKGDILLNAPGEIFLLQKQNQPFEYIYIYFTQEPLQGKNGWICESIPEKRRLENLYINGTQFRRHQSIRINMDHEFDKMLQIFESQFPFSDIELKGKLITLFSKLLRYSISSDIASRNLDDYSICEEICDYIVQNYKKSLTLKSLSRQVKMSPFHLAHKFKNVIGTSPIKFMINIRIKESQSLLEKTNLRISEIANESGFNDCYYFTRIFKKYTGVTPSEYRKSTEKIRKKPGWF